MLPESQHNLQIPDEVHAAIVYSIDSGCKGENISNEKIDQNLVHKRLIENVIISPPIELDKEKKIYRTKVLFDTAHKFFFDHELSHLPGILLLEAARQFGTAISHLFFNIPSGYQFILHDLGSQFVAGATTDNDVFIDVMITDAKIKKNKVRGLSGVGYVHQNGQVIGKITSSWSIIPSKVLAHLAKFH